MGQSYAVPRRSPDRTGSDRPPPSTDLPGSNAFALEQMPALGEQDDAGSSILRSLLAGDAQTLGAAPDDASAEEQAFLATSWPLLEDFQPGTGGIFDAQLAGDQLTITLKVAFDFVPGDPTNAPPGLPPEELEWTPEAMSTFRAEYIRSVTGTWSGCYQIRSTRPGWTTQLDTTVAVVESADDPHFKIGVLKYPPDVFPHTGVVIPAGFHSEHHPGTADRYDRIPNEAGDESGTSWLDSNSAKDAYPPALRPEDSPGLRSRRSIYFDIGESSLDSEDRGALGEAASAMQANPAWRAELTGRASADGDYATNFALSRDRSRSVQSELERNGIASERIVAQNVGEESGYKGAAWKAKANDPQARRVDVDLVEGRDQQGAAHEAGHMFGLGDEYPNGGEKPGDPYDADYMKLISENAEIPPGSLPTQGKGTTDSIMSEGMNVKNWHYAPFVAAVKKITGSQDWIV